MYVKTKGKRLIVINHEGKKYEVVPGVNKTTNIPAKAASLPFVKKLLDEGELVEVSAKQAAADEKAADKEESNSSVEGEVVKDAVTQ